MTLPAEQTKGILIHFAVLGFPHLSGSRGQHRFLQNSLSPSPGSVSYPTARWNCTGASARGLEAPTSWNHGTHRSTSSARLESETMIMIAPLLVPSSARMLCPGSVWHVHRELEPHPAHLALSRDGPTRRPRAPTPPSRPQQPAPGYPATRAQPERAQAPRRSARRAVPPGHPFEAGPACHGRGHERAWQSTRQWAGRQNQSEDEACTACCSHVQPPTPPLGVTMAHKCSRQVQPLQANSCRRRPIFVVCALPVEAIPG